jgi:hypothetical protein
MPTLAGAAVDDAAAAGAGSGLGATGTGGGGSGVLGADGPTGAGAGEAVGRGATDVTAEWGDATLGALIVSLGGAFLAPVTRFGFAFSALTFVARPAVVFVAGFLAFVACLAGCFAAAALPVFLLAAATGLTGCLAAVLRPSFFVAFGVMYEKSIALCGCTAFHAPSKRKLAIAPVGNLPPRGGTSSPESASASANARSCRPGL